MMKSKRYFDYEIFKNEFDNSQKDLEKRKSIRKLKDYIKFEYKRQLQEGLLDIEAEKIRLEKELGIYYHIANDKNNYFRTLITFTITTMITSGLLEIVKALQISSLFKCIISIIIINILLLLITQLDLDSKHYEKDFVNFIALKVLKEIEEY